MVLSAVLKQFGLDADAVSIEPVTQGLINSTWKICAREQQYILQKINSSVFKHPEDIDTNISLIAGYLKQQHPGYLFTSPVAAGNSKTLVWQNGEAFRLFPFIKNTHTISSVTTAGQAFEAAKQFAKFTASLHSFDIALLKVTLPDFHNLSLRYRQFEAACESGNKERIAKAGSLVSALKQRIDIVEKFEEIKTDPDFKLRVTHHDSKISNVLFDENDKGLCVIDLDTVMPGYFISDVGDMMRTYLSAANEEEKDFEKIEVRKDIYHAIIEGYMNEMGNELTEKEKDYFLYAGLFLTYMQALRFLTDYLLDDVYYGAAYNNHNLVRAENQKVLLEKMEQAFL
ncbi:MAG: aminoglycoside phosphotransferase family protein [Ferruginibacter sp.]